MNKRKKQTAVVAMATVLSVTTIASPLPVMAQEGINIPSSVIQGKKEQLKTAPDIILPENLQATAGMTLQEIVLPENWTWADASAVTTAERTEYPARLTVDDITYDYSETEGYHAQEHYVERMVTVIVEPAKIEAVEPAQGKPRMLRNNMPTTYGVGDVVINVDNFPDDEFRTWLEQQDYGADRTITQEEIANITSIYVANNVNIKDLTGIGHFTALKELDCSNTGITSLDVSKNTALTKLYCAFTGIKSLDISKNTSLTELHCIYTGITSLDISKNTSLTNLNCSSTGITSLDVSKNTSLTNLTCPYTGITSLDVSKNTSLTILNCSGTGITSLDVSKNTALTELYCKNTSLAYLNIGQNNNLFTIDKSNLRPVSLGMTEDTFNMADEFADIDVSKVTVTSGADYDSTTGIMSNYSIGTPIIYTYDCGTSSGGEKQKINVTLNLMEKADSSISVTEDLNKTYDGIAVSATPTVSKTGSTGAVSYKWEKKISATDWEMIDTAPTDAGTYRVTAILASDDNYKGKTSNAKEFAIAQAEPGYTVPQGLEATYGQTLADVTLPKGFAWTDAAQSVGNVGTNTFTAVFTPDDTKNYKTVEDISVALTVKKADNAQTGTLSLEGWTYGDSPAAASVGFRFGAPRFLYSDRADGTYTDTLPTSAGTWYVKAVVDGTDNFGGAESEPVSFVIAAKNTTSDSQMAVPDMNADTDLNKLVIKDGDKVLVQGTDYDVAKMQDGKKVTVAITFKGNYTGTITKNYTVEDKAPSGGDKDKENKPDGTKDDGTKTNGTKTDNKDAGNKSSDNKNGAVQTGDTTPVGLWAALMAFSAGAVVFLKRKRHEEETEK